MNATAATRKRRTDGTPNIFKTSVNVAVPNVLPSLSMKFALKLKPARVAIELLPQDLQYPIAGHTATMLNLLDDVRKKEAGISKFNKTENDNDLNITTCLNIMKKPLSGSKAVKGTETYEQLETRMDTLLQNYKIQLTKIILEVTKFEVK